MTRGLIPSGGPPRIAHAGTIKVPEKNHSRTAIGIREEEGRGGGEMGGGPASHGSADACIYHLHRLELKSSFSRETVNNAL
jgi:hypothetical protein